MPSIIYPQFAATDSIENYEFMLNKITRVEGRQGIAVDSASYYVSGSKELFKYDRHGKLIVKNTEPFKNIEAAVNHFGDIDCYAGKIYTPLEYFKDGVGINFRIGIYNAATLEFEKAIVIDTATGQKEASGISVDVYNNVIWMSDWTDGSSVFKYDLNTGKYLGKILLLPKTMWQQGVLALKNYLLITSDDGDAEVNEADNLYAVNKNIENQDAVKPVSIKVFDDIKRQGEIEGLTYDIYSNELLVLFNRGAKIIKGMPKGFYEGYDKEIHEVYHYTIKRKK